jgi:hypothetical protein
VVYVVPKVGPTVPFEKSKVGVWVDRPGVECPGVSSVILGLSAAETGIKELMLACPGMYDTVKEL